MLIDFGRSLFVVMCILNLVCSFIAMDNFGGAGWSPRYFFGQGIWGATLLVIAIWASWWCCGALTRVLSAVLLTTSLHLIWWVGYGAAMLKEGMAWNESLLQFIGSMGTLPMSLFTAMTPLLFIRAVSGWYLSAAPRSIWSVTDQRLRCSILFLAIVFAAMCVASVNQSFPGWWLASIRDLVIASFSIVVVPIMSLAILSSSVRPILLSSGIAIAIAICLLWTSAVRVSLREDMTAAGLVVAATVTTYLVGVLLFWRSRGYRLYRSHGAEPK